MNANEFMPGFLEADESAGEPEIAPQTPEPPKPEAADHPPSRESPPVGPWDEEVADTCLAIRESDSVDIGRRIASEAVERMKAGGAEVPEVEGAWLAFRTAGEHLKRQIANAAI